MQIQQDSYTSHNVDREYIKKMVLYTDQRHQTDTLIVIAQLDDILKYVGRKFFISITNCVSYLKMGCV